MANYVFPGYRGYAALSGTAFPTPTNFRFSDASITARQDVNAQDIIMGDWDHDAYNYGKIEVGGTIGGPVTETFASATNGVFKWACNRGPDAGCGALAEATTDLYYFCGTPTGGNIYKHRQFTGMLVNSVTFSCAAGDVATFSLDVVGQRAGNWDTTNPPTNLGVSGTIGGLYAAEKLITWDKVAVSITADTTLGGSGHTSNPDDATNIAFSNFDFTVGNNIETMYAIGLKSDGTKPGDLFPFALVPGLRTITGTLSVYNTPRFDGATTFDDYIATGTGTLTFSIGGASIVTKVRFHRIEPASSVGAIVSTIGYSGVTHQSGPYWNV